MKSLVLLLPLSLLLIAGCDGGGPPPGSERVETVRKRPGLEAAEPERRFLGNGVGNQLLQRDTAAAPPLPGSEPAVADQVAEDAYLKIKLVSETVTLPGGRQHTLRSCQLSGRADRIKYLEISPNGRYLVLGLVVKGPDGFPQWQPGPDCGRVFVIDQRDGKIVMALKAGASFYRDHGMGSYNCGVVLSPDCSHVASVLHDSEIEVLGIGPGAKPIRLEGGKGPTPKWVRWSPDGSLLACLREDHANPPRTFVDVWDGKTGKKFCRFEGWRFVFPTDGKTILTESDPYRLWGARTGRMIARGKANVVFFGDHRVRRSPAGRLAVFPRYPRSPYQLKEEKEGRILILVSRGTGKAFLTVTSPEPDWPKHWAKLYPSDKYLAVSYPSQNFLVAEAYAAKANPGERFERDEFTAQIWDLSGLPIEQVDESANVAKLSKEEKEKSWADLAGEDNGRAYWATRKLLDSSGQLSAFLEPRIKPAPPLPKGQIKRWVADLDSRSFQARQAAEQALTKHADLALPELEKRLGDKKNLPLELRQRAERIVSRIHEEPVADETGRLLWVVELLEQWGTPEAKKLLKRLAAGAPDAWVTLEAKASLELLDRKK